MSGKSLADGFPFIRLVSASEATRIYLSLIEAVGWEKRDPQALRRACDGSVNWVVEIDGKPVAALRVVGDHIFNCFAVDLIVHPGFQRRGLGRLLMDQVIEDANVLDGCPLYLIAESGVEGFYEKLQGKRMAGFCWWDPEEDD